MFEQPWDTLHLSAILSCRTNLIPKNFVAKRILDNHQTQASTPISRIHIYHDIFVFRDDLHMVHRFQAVPYYTFVDAYWVPTLTTSACFRYTLFNCSVSSLLPPTERLWQDLHKYCWREPLRPLFIVSEDPQWKQLFVHNTLNDPNV